MKEEGFQPLSSIVLYRLFFMNAVEEKCLDPRHGTGYELDLATQRRAEHDALGLEWPGRNTFFFSSPQGSSLEYIFWKMKNDIYACLTLDKSTVDL